nr:hypothetical protein [Tanacetum cinerariifolium]
MNQNLERATTTGSSLEAKQDNVNINNTQSKATLNEPSSIGTSSENTKTTQAPKIDSLKRKVKKLEKKQRSRTHKLKRLHKVGLTTRVDSSNEASLCEDASKQERINDIGTDEGITLVSTHDDAETFDVDKDLHGEEVFVAKQDKNVVENEFNASEVQVSTAVTTATISIDENYKLNLIRKNKDLQEIVLKKQEVNSDLIKEWNDIEAKIDDDYKLAERLQAEEQQELNDTKKGYIVYETFGKKDKVLCCKESRRKEKQTTNKSTTKEYHVVNTFVDYNIELLEESSKKAEAEVTERSSKRAGTELKQESSKKKKIDDDQETAELKYHMLKSFDREDVETLCKLVKAKHGSTRPEEEYERVLWREKTARKAVKQVEHPRQKTYRPRGNQRNWDNMMSQKLEIWNNNQRVNHKVLAKKTHPYATKNMVPRAVLMRSGLVSVNTARQVNDAHPKTTVNAASTMSYFSKSTHSTIKKPIHKKTAFKNNNVNQRVNTVRSKTFNTVRPKAVVKVVMGNKIMKKLIEDMLLLEVTPKEGKSQAKGKQSSIFKERDFDVQAMMDADYELAARLKAEEQR